MRTAGLVHPVFFDAEPDARRSGEDESLERKREFDCYHFSG